MKPGTPPFVETIIDMALEEDLGRGDVTTRLCVPPEIQGVGRVVARQDLVLYGLDVFIRTMEKVDPAIVVEARYADGDKVATNENIAIVKGPTASLLMGERVALNFLQRLCGTASLTRSYVDAVGADSKVRLVDTRKTTPGLRYLERQAVLAGGGNNHRVDLGGGILIKENHIAAAGSVTEAVTRCKQGGPHPLAVEVEVTNASELQEALDAGADVIMLDNMGPARIVECLKMVNGKALIEASGGINLSTVADIAATGVDIISVGAFTHSAPGADISFLIENA